MPPPVVESVSTAQNVSSATTLTISKPSGVVPGDLLVATIHIMGVGSVVPPSGWTNIFSQEQGTTHKIHVYWLIAGGSEPSSYDWTTPSVLSGGGIARITGHRESFPIDVFASAETVSSLTHTVPSVTTTVADTILLRGLAIDRNDASRPFAIPSGTTLVYHVNNASASISPHSMVVRSDYVGPGVTGTMDFTFGGSARPASVFIIAIAPVLDGGGPPSLVRRRKTRTIGVLS